MTWVGTTSRRHGFTLIELLVVVVIVAILAAILLPVFGRAIRSGQERDAQERQRQLIAATLLYAADYDDFVPPYNFSRDSFVKDEIVLPSRPDLWRDSLLEYAKNTEVFFSPFDSVRGYHIEGDDDSDTTYTSYQCHPALLLPSVDSKLGFVRLHTADPLATEFPYVADLCWTASGKEQGMSCIAGDRGCMAYLSGNSECIPILNIR